MAQNITLKGTNWRNVPAVNLPKTGGGKARFTDVTPTTAIAADVTSGKVFFKADGSQAVGTSVPPVPSFQSKSATPTKSQQVITPDSSYDGLSSVTVEPIPSQYIVPSGTKNIDANGNGIDVKQYESVNVNVPAPTPSLQNKSIAPATSQQTVTPDTGYDGLSSVTVDAMPTGTAGTPSASKGNVSNHSVDITPSVTNAAGYIQGGTKTGAAVSVSASELVSGSETKTANGTYDVTNLETLVVDVPQSGGMNTQVYQDYDYVSATSYTATDVTLTVEKSGVYTISWMGWRNTTSGTSGSRLYINGTAYGSASTTFVGSYGQFVTLTNVSLNAGDVLVVHARSRSTSYRMYVGGLVIQQTA